MNHSEGTAEQGNKRSMESREALLAEAAEVDWVHALDFGDYQSPGRYNPETAQNRTLFGIMDLLGNIDLAGQSCLDIGTADGLVAFNMATQGAAEVVATDVEQRRSFMIARDLLELDVELFTDTTFENIIDKVGEHTFDVVVCAGVMHHMLNPFDSILKARRLLKRNGLLLLQTRYDPARSDASLDFKPVSAKADALDIFWVPSKAAVTGMLALGGFQLLAIRRGNKLPFLTTLACNVTLDEVNDRRGGIMEQLQSGIDSAEFCAELPEESSTVFYSGRQDERAIDDLTYQPDFPPHPTEPKPVVGDG